ncbi:MAG: hypothetical protein AAF846_20835 [Chloroflexota bacterium]
MFRFILRWSLLITLGLAAVVALAIGLGRIISPYPALLSYDWSSDGQARIYTDISTRTTYRTVTNYGDYNVNYNGQLGYRTHRVGDETEVYIQRMWQHNEQLITSIPTQSRWVTGSWSYDFEQPMYIVETIREENDRFAIIYQVDMQTGDYQTIGTYPFMGSSVQFAYPSYDDLFILGSAEGARMYINFETQETLTIDADKIEFVQLDDRPHALYSMREIDGDPDTTSYRHILVDLSTFEQSELSSSSPDISNMTLLTMRHDNNQVLFEDENDYLWLYDLATQTYQALPTDYRFIQGVYGWAPDNLGILLAKITDETEESVTADIGLYDVDSDSFTALFTETDNYIITIRYQSRLFGFYPDSPYLLVTNNRGQSNMEIAIYDVRTGDLLFDQETLPTISSSLLTWGYIPRQR